MLEYIFFQRERIIINYNKSIYMSILFTLICIHVQLIIILSLLKKYIPAYLVLLVIFIGTTYWSLQSPFHSAPPQGLKTRSRSCTPSLVCSLVAMVMEYACPVIKPRLPSCSLSCSQKTFIIALHCISSNVSLNQRFTREVLK